MRFNKDNGELQAGKVIFETIKRLFGHTTIKFIFMHLIDFYVSNKGISFDILTLPGLKKLEKYLKPFIMNPMSKSRNKRSIAPSRATIERHLYSILFSNCYAVLPTVDNVNTENNIINFGYSPMPFINSPFSVRNVVDMNNIIRSKFNYFYLKYYSELFAFNDIEAQRFEFFQRSGWEIMEVLEKKLSKIVYNLNPARFSQKYKNSLFSRLITASMKEIFQIGKTKKTQGDAPNLRIQIEDLLIGYGEYRGEFAADSNYLFNRGTNNARREITFYNVIMENGEPFRMFLDKDDFSGANLMIWRHSKITHASAMDLIISQNKGAIADRRQVLENIIKRNGGKVTIDVAVNLGEQGYQYIKTDSGNPASYIDLLPFSTGDSTVRWHFEIDFNSDLEAGKKLDYLIAVSMTYIQPGSFNLNAMEFLFLIKNELGKTIIAFGGEELLLAEEIFTTDDRKRNYELIKDAYSGGSLELSDLLLWEKCSNYFIMSEKKFRQDYLVKIGFSDLW